MPATDIASWLPDLIIKRWPLAVDAILRAGKDVTVEEPPAVNKVDASGNAVTVWSDGATWMVV